MSARDWLLAELDRRIGLCRAATPGPWDTDANAVRDGSQTALALTYPRPGSPYDLTEHRANAAFIAAHDPTSLAALYEWMRGEVGKHEVGPNVDYGEECAECVAGWYPNQPMPACPFVAGLASALGYPAGDVALGNSQVVRDLVEQDRAGAVQFEAVPGDLPPERETGDGERGTPAGHGESEGTSRSNGPAAVASYVAGAVLDALWQQFGHTDAGQGDEAALDADYEQWRAVAVAAVEALPISDDPRPASREAPSAHAEGPDRLTIASAGLHRARGHAWNGMALSDCNCMADAAAVLTALDAPPQAPEARSAEQGDPCGYLYPVGTSGATKRCGVGRDGHEEFGGRARHAFVPPAAPVQSAGAGMPEKQREVRTLTPEAAEGRVLLPVVLAYLVGEPIAREDMPPDEALALADGLITAARRAQAWRDRREQSGDAPRDLMAELRTSLDRAVRPPAANPGEGRTDG